jgi:kinesin family protein C1
MHHIYVLSLLQVFSLLKKASENRAVAATNSNERSSRSHSVFRMFIKGHNDQTEEKCSGQLTVHGQMQAEYKVCFQEA